MGKKLGGWNKYKWHNRTAFALASGGHESKSRRCQNHPRPGAKGTKLAVLSAREGRHTLSSLSVAATLANRGLMWAHSMRKSGNNTFLRVCYAAWAAVWKDADGWLHVSKRKGCSGSGAYPRKTEHEAEIHLELYVSSSQGTTTNLHNKYSHTHSNPNKKDLT